MVNLNSREMFYNLELLKKMIKDRDIKIFPN